MPSRWPSTVEFQEVVVHVDETICASCGGPLRFRKIRHHCFYTLQGPVDLVCHQKCCADTQCPAQNVLVSPGEERRLTMPRWCMGWDLSLWLGFRRYKRHWDIPQLHAELADSYDIHLCTETLREYLQKYQLMVAARHQDLTLLREVYQACDDVILSIDGIQPEKGHEVVYVVRELRRQRVWFAESLLSSALPEIVTLIRRAKQIAAALALPVRGWITDKQDAFVTAIAAECPQAFHRYCANHFLRDVAQPMLERDSQAKVQMRKRVRGLRGVEKTILAVVDSPLSAPGPLTPEQSRYAAQIVLNYCAAVRGILNDNHGGPLRPPGWRMADALEALCVSLERTRNHPETPISAVLERLLGYIRQGLAVYAPEKPTIAAYVADMTRIWDLLAPKTGAETKRLAEFQQLRATFAETDDPITQHMGRVMQSFEKGLFVGSDVVGLPSDNLALERWITYPKGHERRIHGRQHVGLRMIIQGPTLLPTVDAHLGRTTPFTVQELTPYADASPPASQRQAVARHRVMTNARSKKNDRSY